MTEPRGLAPQPTGSERAGSLPMAIKLSRSRMRTLVWLLRTFARLAGPRNAARVLVARMDWGEIRPDLPTVLCLQRPHFKNDIDELRKRTQINWVCINNEFLGHVQSAWVPPEMRKQTAYQRCRTPEYTRYWQRLERFGGELLDIISRRAAIAAVMTAHIDYWQPEGVRLATKERGLPFLALCRENPTLPYEQDAVRSYYSSFAFEGDGVAVFSEATRDIFVNSGACAPDRLYVTGAPRMDVWHETPRRVEPRTLITLLSYRDPDYLAPRSFVEVLQVFVDAARTTPANGVEFLVKAKNKADLEAIRGLVGDVPPRLTISFDTPLPHVLPRSRLVVGFNSMSVLEALLSDAKIVIPHWADADRSSSQLMFDPRDPAYSDAVSFAGDPKQLKRAIEEAAARDPDPAGAAEVEARLTVLNRHMHVTHDEASAAVEEFVREFTTNRPRSLPGR